MKLRYVNPLTGGPAMPTMSAALQLLEAGFSTEPYRATDATVFVVVEGRGRSEIGGAAFDWRRMMCSWRRVGLRSGIELRAKR